MDLENIRTILSKPYGPELPFRVFDAVLIARSYHEMHDCRAVLAGAYSALKPGGWLVVFDGASDHAPTRAREVQMKRHELDPILAKAEIGQAGFVAVELDEKFNEITHRDWLPVATTAAKASASDGSKH